MATDEEVLAGRAVTGDRAALASLLERHGSAVSRKLEHSIPRRWRALLTIDDVMQEAYTEAFLGISRFSWRGEGSFPAWLEALARYTLLDAVRLLEADKRGGNRRRTEPDSSCALCDLIGLTTTTPSRAAARNEAAAFLKEAIEGLPPKYRQAVQMYDLEGRTIEQAAFALRCSAGALHMLRLRAHRMLAERLGTVSRYLSRSS